LASFTLRTKIGGATARATGHAGPAPLRLQRLLTHPGAALRVGERGEPLGQAQVHHDVPDIEVVEKVVFFSVKRGLNGMARSRLNICAPPASPLDVGPRVGVEAQEEHRPAAGDRHVAQVIEVGRARLARALRGGSR